MSLYIYIYIYHHLFIIYEYIYMMIYPQMLLLGNAGDFTMHNLKNQTMTVTVGFV